MKYKSKLNREQFLEIETEVYDMFSNNQVKAKINSRYSQLKNGDMSALSFMHALIRTLNQMQQMSREDAQTKIVETHEYKKYKERNLNEDNIRNNT